MSSTLKKSVSFRDEQDDQDPNDSTKSTEKQLPIYQSAPPAHDYPKPPRNSAIKSSNNKELSEDKAETSMPPKASFSSDHTNVTKTKRKPRKGALPIDQDELSARSLSAIVVPMRNSVDKANFPTLSQPGVMLRPPTSNNPIESDVSKDIEEEHLRMFRKSKTEILARKSLSSKVDPNFVRRLFSLDKLSQDIPAYFINKDYNPFLEAFKIHQNEPRVRSRLKNQLTILQDKLKPALEPFIPYCADDFPTVVGGVSTMVSTVIESSILVREMQEAIHRDRTVLKQNTGDLKTMYYRNIHLTENIDVLDQIEELTSVIPTVSNNVANGRMEQAVKTLMTGVELLNSPALKNIGALEKIRSDIYSRKSQMLNDTIGSLLTAVFGGVPLTSDSFSLYAKSHRISGHARFQGPLAKLSGKPSDRFSKHTEQYVSELVRALSLLQREDWIDTLQDRIPSALDKIINDVAMDLRAKEYSMQFGSQEKNLEKKNDLDFLDLEQDDTLIGRKSVFSANLELFTTEYERSIMEELEALLPSRALPNISKQLCALLMESIREKFIVSLQNFTFLLSILSSSDNQIENHTLLKNAWYKMEVKITEVVDSLIGKRLSVEPAQRKKEETDKALEPNRNARSNADFPLSNFPFVSNEFVSKKSQLTNIFSDQMLIYMKSTSDRERINPSSNERIIVNVVDAIRSCELSVTPSPYNLPEIHGVILRLSSDGARIISHYSNDSKSEQTSQSLNLLVNFADTAVKDILLSRLWADLQRAADVLVGRPHTILKVDTSLYADENSALPVLTAMSGILWVIDEVVEICSKIVLYSDEIGNVLGNFLSIVEEKFKISLGVIESWTAAGALLENSGFISMMEEGMQTFFTPSKASDRPVMVRSKDKGLSRAKYDAIQQAVSSRKNEKLESLHDDEFKALVRLLSSVNVVLRALQVHTNVDTNFPEFPEFLDNGAASGNDVVSREREKQRYIVAKKTFYSLMSQISPYTVGLEKVSERGLILLRVEMLTRCFISIQDALDEILKDPQNINLAEDHGVKLGQSLASGERIVKFNLDVAKREYIFLDLNDTISAFFEIAVDEIEKKGQKIRPDFVHGIEHYINSAGKNCEIIEFSSTSDFARLLGNLRNRAS